MKNKIYIIGDTKNINICWDTNILKIESKLIEIGFEVINPVDKFLVEGISFEEARKKNLQDLTLSNSVYVMPNIPINEYNKNIEVKLALDLNLTFIVDIFDLNEIYDEPSNKKKGFSYSIFNNVNKSS